MKDIRWTRQIWDDYGLRPSDFTEIIATAAANAWVGYDKITGEYDATKIAESVAQDLEHAEWLDDETHPVWEIALFTALIHEEATP
jgi:D-alanyl-D-alanine dipeptidase